MSVSAGQAQSAENHNVERIGFVRTGLAAAYKL